MKKTLAILFLFFVVFLPAAGQAIPPLPQSASGTGDITSVWGDSTGDVSALTAASGDTLDASLADSSKPFKAGAGADRPATCAEGDTYWTSSVGTVDAPLDSLSICYGTNQWMVYLNQSVTSAANPAFNSINVTGTNSVTVGTGSSTTGIVQFKNATNANVFQVISGVSTDALSWTLPTAAPGGADYLLNVDANGTMGYTNPASFIPVTAVPWQKDVNFPLPAAGDVAGVRTTKVITLESVKCIADPGDAAETVVVDIQECTITHSACPTIITGTLTCTSAAEATATLADTTIAADKEIYLVLGTVTGTVSRLRVTLRGTEAQ